MNTPPDNAEIWLLAGQSNMAGSGGGGPYETPAENVWLYSLRDEWIVAREPFLLDRYQAPEAAFKIMRGERMRNVIDEAYLRKQAAEYPVAVQAASGGGGLGLSFGKALATSLHRPVGLIFCAKGDTRIEEWDPEYDGDPYMALYQTTLRRIRSAGRPVTGILWYQGESDTFDDKGKVYAENMRELVAAFRRDLANPRLPFFYVQIAACVMQTEEELPDWNLVQESQRLLEAELAPGGMCPAIDLPLWDGIHLSTPAQQRLGRRLAKVVRRRFYNDTQFDIGPRPVAVERESGDPCGLRVHYASVNSRLLPADRVAGFSLQAPGAERNMVCSAFVPQDDLFSVRVRSYCPIPDGSSLWYGKGLMPLCNLVDAADLAAPVFGPWLVPV